MPISPGTDALQFAGLIAHKVVEQRDASVERVERTWTQNCE
jgi:hypothetical protein